MAVNKVLQRGVDWMIGHEIAELDKKSLPNTEKTSQTGLSLPIFPGLKSEEIIHICDSIKEFFQN